MLLDLSSLAVLVRVVDCSLKGSEHGLEAWQILRRYVLQGVSPPLDEWNKITDLLDRALDDCEGVDFKVDLSQEDARTYDIGLTDEPDQDRSHRLEDTLL